MCTFFFFYFQHFYQTLVDKMEVFFQFLYVGQSFWHFPADGASVEPSELGILNRVAIAQDRVDPFHAKAASKHEFSDNLEYRKHLWLLWELVYHLFITGPVCISDGGSTTESSVEIPLVIRGVHINFCILSMFLFWTVAVLTAVLLVLVLLIAMR